MRIGELAKATGTPVRTIRFYEEIGVLPPADRAESGYRIFSKVHLRNLRFIRRARELGLSLEQVREIITVASQSVQPCECVRETLQRNIERIDRRVAELEAMRIDIVRALESLNHHEPPTSGAQKDVCPAIESVSGRSQPSLDSPVDWRV